MTFWETDPAPDDGKTAYGLAGRSGGHSWQEGMQGRYCSLCGRRWAEVVGATEEAKGQYHYAHAGGLVEHELKEFAAEIDWLWNTIIDAASAGGK
jgi:hypothetical protein